MNIFGNRGQRDTFLAIPGAENDCPEETNQFIIKQITPWNTTSSMGRK